VLKCSGHGCDLVMSVKKWKDFYLLPKNRHYLLMQLKHIFIIVSVQPGADYVVEQMKLLTILLVVVLFWYNGSINPDMISCSLDASEASWLSSHGCLVETFSLTSL